MFTTKSHKQLGTEHFKSTEKVHSLLSSLSNSTLTPLEWLLRTRAVVKIDPKNSCVVRGLLPLVLSIRTAQEQADFSNMMNFLSHREQLPQSDSQFPHVAHSDLVTQHLPCLRPNVYFLSSICVIPFGFPVNESLDSTSSPSISMHSTTIDVEEQNKIMMLYRRYRDQLTPNLIKIASNVKQKWIGNPKSPKNPKEKMKPIKRSFSMRTQEENEVKNNPWSDLEPLQPLQQLFSQNQPSSFQLSKSTSIQGPNENRENAINDRTLGILSPRPALTVSSTKDEESQLHSYICSFWIPFSR